MKKLTGARIVIEALIQEKVNIIFGYPGGAVLPIYDELFKQDKIRHILVRHEQAAVHAAEGYARSTGKVGVVLVTSGPGATNTVTGLTDAMMDSVPVVCISGQVPTHMIGNDAFQEADIVGITRPCTKHNYLVKDVNKLAGCIHSAFYIAKNGRPGPVLVDVPKDIQTFKTNYPGKKQTKILSYYKPTLLPDDKKVDQMIDLLQKKKISDIQILINRYQPELVRQGHMLDSQDIWQILDTPVLGVLPESVEVLISSNKGEPFALNDESLLHEAIFRATQRLRGVEVPFIDLNTELDSSVWERVKQWAKAQVSAS